MFSFCFFSVYINVYINVSFNTDVRSPLGRSCIRAWSDGVLWGIPWGGEAAFFSRWALPVFFAVLLHHGRELHTPLSRVAAATCSLQMWSSSWQLIATISHGSKAKIYH